MYSSALVRLFVSRNSSTELIFTKFDVKVAHWPRKKTLQFGSNPDHVTLRYVSDGWSWLGGAE